MGSEILNKDKSCGVVVELFKIKKSTKCLVELVDVMTTSEPAWIVKCLAMVYFIGNLWNFLTRMLDAFRWADVLIKLSSLSIADVS